MTATSQCMEALASANDVRVGIADFRREIAGRDHYDAIISVIDVIESRYDERFLGSARVKHLLTAIPGIGETKAHKLLTVAQIYNTDKRLRDVTKRQRDLLVNLLTQQAWRKKR